MEKIKLGIIGLGGMGSGHIKNVISGKVENVEITALCDIVPERVEEKKALFEKAPAGFCSSEELIRSGLCEAVLIATPHYFHPTIAIDAFENGLHVMSEKPIGVYTKIVHDMIAAAKKSGKIFSIMFNQRTNPAYQRMREIITSGELGEIVRANWIITDWFRTQRYYDSGGWRATWEGEGGGVLLNQCPHQIDLMQWICGVPKRVRTFAQFGKYHDIEVEDDVTAYYEYENGATGLFITTTGEYPGTNRFEVSGDKGKLIVEGNKLKYYKTKESVKDVRDNSDQGFAQIGVDVSEEVFESGGSQHIGILRNFADSILNGTELLAKGEEGIKGLSISNAMHLSAWTDDWVDLPFDEDKFYDMLQEKIKNSNIKKQESSSVMSVEGTFGGAASK